MSKYFSDTSVAERFPKMTLQLYEDTKKVIQADSILYILLVIFTAAKGTRRTKCCSYILHLLLYHYIKFN